MKKTSILLSIFFVASSCSNAPVKKPDNLIDRDEMINILYDLSIIEASHSTGYSFGVPPIESNNYIFKKYKIDSLQFAQSNKYYAADVKEYKKMYEAVNEKLTEKDAEITKRMLEKTGKELAPISK